MPKVSSKRQITLPVGGCSELDIQPGDEVEIFRYQNQFNIIKKEAGAAAGLLKGVKVNKKISERDSLIYNFE
jgi:bifunctional DNA-binding transcriptional regulator/antitoxin component of YhaV-PrlF toxin-antitoxin module